MPLPQAIKAQATAHTVNAHATALGEVVSVNVNLATEVTNAVSTTNLVRPAFMTKSAQKESWVPPQLLYIYNQLLNYDGAYRI